MPAARIYAVEVFSQMVLFASTGLFYESGKNEMERDRYSQRQVFCAGSYRIFYYTYALCKTRECLIIKRIDKGIY